MPALARHDRRVALARKFARRMRLELGPSLRRVTLYGSVARAEDRASSDIDLLVEVRRRTRAVEDSVFGAVAEIVTEEGELLVPIVLTSSEIRRKLSPSFVEGIRREGIVLVRG